MESFDRLPHVASLAMRKAIRDPEDKALRSVAVEQLSVSLRLGDITLSEHIQYCALLNGRAEEAIFTSQLRIADLEEAASFAEDATTSEMPRSQVA